MRVVLFAGKGGVGKTTLAAATGAALSAAGRKVLVVSTDSAHSLSDALDVRLKADPSEVDEGLFASEVDTRALLGGAWSTLCTHLATLLPGAGVDEVVPEELTLLPGFEELLALSEVQRMARTGPWEVVVVDCAPAAGAMRLIALPEVCAGYLERVFPTHRRVVRGMLAGLARSKSSAARWDAAADALSGLAEHLDELLALISDQAATSVRLVLTPERVAAAETRRSVTALALQGVRVDGLLANRLMPAVGDEARGPAADWVRTRRREQDGVLAALRADLPGVPVRTVEHRAAEPVGLVALRELAADLGGSDDPSLDQRGGELTLAVTHVGGSGLDSEYQLRMSLPLLNVEEVALSRVQDDLAVTAAGYRRLVGLPSVLRRCTVIGAEVDAGGLVVRFRPDPAVWMRCAPSPRGEDGVTGC